MLEKPPVNFFLLTSVDEGAQGIGSIFLKDLVGGLARKEFFWFTVKPFFLGGRLARLGRMGGGLRSLLVRFGAWQNARISLFQKFSLPRRIKKIEGLLKKASPQTILLTASSPELISIGRKLVERGYKVIVFVWDDPEYLIGNLKLNRAQREKVLGDFDRLMNGASAAAVISDEMFDRYGRVYCVPCQIIRHGTAPPLEKKINRKSCSIEIVFAGSLYSKREWNALVDALVQADWLLAGRAVNLTFIGSFPLKGAKKPKSMRHIPPVSNSRALELMQGMDIGYLPYWFDEKFETVVRTSFPGKMTAYAAAGLAVFHHAPAYSSVNKFIKKYPFGLSCNSLDAKVILSRMEQLVLKMDGGSLAEARERAMQEELSDRAMAKAFENLLALARRNPIAKN